ncbi:ABC transporter permease [Haloarchaeobius sp. HRN-SO-5]|uniref:ABC transporter permease n=1 Tax=Haloarchaeobius sp. HRN-SO-5 TaxID=3446118 RepID=UPI003EBF8C34
MSTPAVDTGLRGYLGFFRASARKRFVLLVRYPVNTLSQLGTVFLVFLVLFYGGNAVAPAAMSDTIGGIIVGYLLWSMSLTAYSGLSWNVTREAQWGTLEQLFMSPFGFGRVMLAKTVVNLLEAFLWGVATLGFMLVVTGRTLALDPLTLLPLGALALAPAVGIGFAFGGLAIRFKRVENAFQLAQFAFVGLIAAPVDQYPFLRWLPLAQGSQLLRTAMQDGVPLWQLPGDELAVLVVTAIGYLALGYAAFTYCQRWARREGVMGHY